MDRHTSTFSDWTTTLKSILASYGQNSAWITDQEGEVMEINESGKKIIPPDFVDFVEKHKSKIDSHYPEAVKIELDQNKSLKGVSDHILSASKIQFQSHSFYIFTLLNSQKETSISSPEMLADDFGIYSWHFDLGTNRFFLMNSAWKKLLGVQSENPTYEDFYSCLSPESFQKFSKLIEETINSGKPFSSELLIDLPAGFQWIWFSCTSVSTESGNQILSGYLKDLSKEKLQKEEQDRLQLWLNSGLSKFRVEGPEGQVIKNWEGNSQGRNIHFIGNQRQTTLVDFRNRPRYKITVDLGKPEVPIFQEAAPKPVEVIEYEVISPAIPENELSLNGNRDHKFLTVTQWLGQSLDAQVSAMGVFDGRNFEWKAWWKSPIRYAMNSSRAGEWAPPIQWLEEVEKDPESQSIWWPQDLLPFDIESNFGDGWMLLTDSISSNETTLFAIQSDDPQSIREKTKHVLKGISLLKQKSDQKDGDIETEIEKLQRQLREKELLLKEMNHRAKNNLSIASSLVKMQAGYSENEDFSKLLKQTQKRLETLASVHEQLYYNKETSGTIDMNEFLTRMIKGLVESFQSDEIKLELNIDPIQLPVKKANTIGLLVNELIVNCFKYAFGEDNPGILKVDFLEKGNSIKLGVSDNGPGIENKTADLHSLGQMLIGEFVNQLNGTMEILSPPGTTYLISFSKN